MSDFSRHAKLVGEAGIRRLADARVAVFGIGGVGGYVAEALARASVGSIVLIDSDDVEQSNVNRQLVALEDTIGRPKVDVMGERIAQINPDCNVVTEKIFVNADNVDKLLNGVTYAVDAVDNVTAKLAIIATSQSKGIRAISAMGAGNKLSGTFAVMDVFETSGDPLAKVMRRELKRRGIKKQKVVCTNELALCDVEKGEAMPSISYMPGLCGLTIAGEVIRDIIGSEDD